MVYSMSAKDDLIVIGVVGVVGIGGLYLLTRELKGMVPDIGKFVDDLIPKVDPMDAINDQIDDIVATTAGLGNIVNTMKGQVNTIKTNVDDVKKVLQDGFDDLTQKGGAITNTIDDLIVNNKLMQDINQQMQDILDVPDIVKVFDDTAGYIVRAGSRMRRLTIL